MINQFSDDFESNKQNFIKGLNKIIQMELTNDFSSLLYMMPSTYHIVLISSDKASQKTGGAFNYDIAYSEYKIF